MSWSGIALSKVGAKPLWLYRLEKDDSVAYYVRRMRRISALPVGHVVDVFHPANVFSPIDVFAQTFEPLPITNSPIRATDNSAKKQVTLTLPRTNATAQTFLGDLGIATTLATIWQGFENDVDAEYPKMFSGEVQLVKPSWTTTSLVCESNGSNLRGKALSEVIQRPCRHALYHNVGCKLTLSDHQITITATSLVANVLTASGASAYDDGYFTGGIIQYGQSMQLITAHTGSTLQVLGSVGALATDLSGGAVDVLLAPGCDRSRAGCLRFDNMLNFGGFEHLTNSPFDGRSVT